MREGGREGGEGGREDATWKVKERKGRLFLPACCCCLRETVDRIMVWSLKTWTYRQNNCLCMCVCVDRKAFRR